MARCRASYRWAVEESRWAVEESCLSSFDLLQDVSRFGGPDEGFGLNVVLFDVSEDGLVKLLDAGEDSTPELSQLLEVGWKWKRGCRAAQFSTSGCLWAA